MMKKLFSLIFILAILFFGCENPVKNVPKERKNQEEKTEIKEDLNHYFDSLQTNSPIPGIAAGIWIPNKNIKWVESFGYSNLEEGTPMTSELIFRIASNTKTMTNTILLQLCDEGKISLSDTLSEYLPNFPKSDSVTIQMLTDMTSGIPDYTQSNQINKWLSRDRNIYFPLDTLISFAKNMDYYFSPGEGWEYSNTNTILIQKIIQEITGNSLKHEMKNRLFRPLSLNKTQYIASGTELPLPHSQGYFNGDTTSPPINTTEYLNTSLTPGSGAAISNILELKKYVKHLVNGYYLSEEMQDHRLNHLVEPEGIPLPIKYGTGWMEWKGFYGHDGGLPGFTSLMLSNPSNGTTVIFWFNCKLAKYNVLDSFARVYEILYRTSDLQSAPKSIKTNYTPGVKIELRNPKLSP